MWAVQTPIPKLILTISIALLISIVTIFADSRGFITPMRGAASVITLPIIGKLSYLRQSIHEFVQVVPTSFTAARQIRTLKLENNELRLQLAEVVSIAKENEVLRREVNILPVKGTQRVLAQVIQLHDNMVVKLSQPIMIKEGAPVTQNNNLVGFVYKPITNELYTVMPVTATAFKAKIKIIHQGAPVDGVIEGQFGSHLRVSKILATSQIAENDIVVMDDANNMQTVGLIVGKIDKVMKVETEVFQQATVIPFYEITTYNTVFVSQ